MKLPLIRPVAAMVLFLPAFLQAQALTLEQAVRNALAQHPNLAVSALQADALSERAKHSTVGTRPDLSLVVEDALGSGSYSGTDVAQTTLSIAWILEGALLDSREAAALSEWSVLRSEIKIQRLDIAAETARDYMHALLLEQRRALIEEAVKQAEGVAYQIKRKVDLGQSPATDALRASAKLADQRLLLEDIEHEIRVAHRELAANWSSVAPQFERLEGDLSTLVQVAPYATLVQRLDDNPSMQAFASRERLAQSRVELEKAEAQSRWRVSAGVRHYAADSELGVVAGVTIPLGGEGRNRAAIQAAALDARATGAEKAAHVIELKTRLFALYEQWQHAMHVAETLQSIIVPALNKAVSQTRSAYQRGQAGFQELAVVQAEWLDASSRLLDVRYKAYISRIEIERLAGMSIEPAIGNVE